MILQYFRSHVLLGPTNRSCKVILLKITFAHPKVTNSQMSSHIHKNILRFEITIEHFFLVDVLYCQNDLAEVLFDVLICEFLALWA